jgi:hypothetical protein
LGLIAEVEEYARFVAGIGLASDGAVTPEAVGLYRALRGGFIRGVVTGGLPRAAGAVGGPVYGDADYATVLNKLASRPGLHSGVARPRLGTVLVDLVAEFPHGAFGLLATISGVTSSARRSIPPADGRSPGARPTGTPPSNGSSGRCRTMLKGLHEHDLRAA